LKVAIFHEAVEIVSRESGKVETGQDIADPQFRAVMYEVLYADLLGVAADPVWAESVQGRSFGTLDRKMLTPQGECLANALVKLFEPIRVGMDLPPLR
jgi:hypothetical protein